MNLLCQKSESFCVPSVPHHTQTIPIICEVKDENGMKSQEGKVLHNYKKMSIKLLSQRVIYTYYLIQLHHLISRMRKSSECRITC